MNDDCGSHKLTVAWKNTEGISEHDCVTHELTVEWKNTEGISKHNCVAHELTVAWKNTEDVFCDLAVSTPRACRFDWRRWWAEIGLHPMFFRDLMVPTPRACRFDWRRRWTEVDDGLQKGTCIRLSNP